MFRTLCISASLLLAAAPLASAQDSLMAGQYVRVSPRKAPAIEGTLVSISAQELVIATSPSDTARIDRKQVKVADVALATEPGPRAVGPSGSESTEPRWVRVKVKPVRRGPAPSLGMHLMF
jgi:hypothetical protein